MTTVTQNAPMLEPAIEHVLVVPRQVLVPQEGMQGLIAKKDFEAEAELILQHGEFLPRPMMEQDPRYKQIIPYLTFIHNGSVFVMQRKATASETRLQSKFSIGIGGHIRSTDITGGDIAQWAKREFAEEISYTGNYTLSALGLINDDSNSVGQVHIGFAYILQGDSNLISINDEHASGILMSKADCLAIYDRMETWSKLVFDAIADRLV
jgi:predicted NUDIX family phosphoesterase